MEQSYECLEAIQVIERLCKLNSEVAKYFGYSFASDCFCGKGAYSEEKEIKDLTYENGYRNDGTSLQFIENTVREKLKKLGKTK